MEWRAEWHAVNQIDILPEYMLGGEPWVVQDGTLGFAAKWLAKLHHSNSAEWNHIRTLPAAKQDELSLVALLATTEHLTAGNVRKDLILANEVDPAAELHTLDLILSSPLHKHSKSPMLWFHRSWLLQHFPKLRNLDHELSIVRQAALHHPRNYYAWSYARELAIVCSQDIEAIAEWAWQLCCQNLSDVSMWSFLAVVDSTKRAEAKQFMDKWPHESIAVYLSNQAVAGQQSAN